MPTVRGIPGPYRFFTYNFDSNEPKHEHVRGVPAIIVRNHARIQEEGQIRVCAIWGFSVRPRLHPNSEVKFC